MEEDDEDEDEDEEEEKEEAHTAKPQRDPHDPAAAGRTVHGAGHLPFTPWRRRTARQATVPHRLRRRQRSA